MACRSTVRCRRPGQCECPSASHTNSKQYSYKPDRLSARPRQGVAIAQQGKRLQNDESNRGHGDGADHAKVGTELALGGSPPKAHQPCPDSPCCQFGQWPWPPGGGGNGCNQERSEEHTSELQSRQYLVCRLLLEKKKKT